MPFREFMKKLRMYLFVDPNSPEGLRYRAERLEKEFGKDNPMVTALRKLAQHKEEKSHDEA